MVFLNFKSYSQKRLIDSLFKSIQSSKNNFIKILNYYKIASVYIELGELNKAESINERLVSFQNSKFKNKTALWYNVNKGYIFELKRWFSKAVNYYFEGIKSVKKDYKNALNYYNESLKSFEKTIKMNAVNQFAK